MPGRRPKRWPQRAREQRTATAAAWAERGTAADEPAVDTSTEPRPEKPVEQGRLIQLLIWRHQGMTQRECAARFGVTDRTIRNWEDRLAPVLRDLSRSLDADGQVGQILASFAAREEDLLRWKRDAEAVGDYRAMIGCSRELRHLHNDRCKLLSRLGLFSRMTFRAPSDVDRSEQQANVLLSLLNRITEDPLSGGEPSDGWRN